MNDPAALDSARENDVRYFRNRARVERRLVRQAATERTRRIHDEMAEHYEAVADLLDTDARHESRSLVSSFRTMLERLSRM